MKKVIIFASAFIFAGILLSSCKSHEKCPAYSKVNTHINNNKVA